MLTVDQNGLHSANGGVEGADEADGEDGGDVGEAGDGLEGDGRRVQDDAHVQRHLKGESQGRENSGRKSEPRSKFSEFCTIFFSQFHFNLQSPQFCFHYIRASNWKGFAS